MPPDYIQVPNNTPPPAEKAYPTTSPLSLALAQFAIYVYAQAVAQLERLRKANEPKNDSYKDRATGDLTPLRLDPSNRKLTPLQIEVQEIVRRYETHLRQVRDGRRLL
jgi:hypothetical protein